MNYHIPVLLDEVINLLDINPEGIYMDCTVGFGGHSESILNNLSSKGLLIGLDLDPYALNKTKEKLSQQFENISLHNCSYSVFPQILEKMGIKEIDGFLFDLGISSYQIDSEHRGFSYMKDASLDMRFNNESANTKTAKELINTISEEELSNSLKKYGDIQKHARIARCIVDERKKKQINTTYELKKVLSKALPYESYKKLSIVFQVIRILVNDEIETIKRTLELTLQYLKIGGRIAIISFHSIEDRIIKHFFKDLVIYKDLSYDIHSQNVNQGLRIITKKPIMESKKNIYKNPRARSAKLRVAERIK